MKETTNRYLWRWGNETDDFTINMVRETTHQHALSLPAIRTSMNIDSFVSLCYAFMPVFILCSSLGSPVSGVGREWPQ